MNGEMLNMKGPSVTLSVSPGKHLQIGETNFYHSNHSFIWKLLLEIYISVILILFLPFSPKIWDFGCAFS